MTDRPKRKAIPMRVQRDACIYALGMRPDQVEFHHNPPIGLRPLNEDGTDTIPPMNDARHIDPVLAEFHKRETFGDSAVPLSGDVSKIAKVKRLEKKFKFTPDETEEIERALARRPKRKIPSRPFQKRRRVP